ncbi:HAD family hydrolase [soil metagenome]
MRPLAVFDIDGTLVDSRHSILQAAVEASRDVGLPDPDYEIVRRGVGLSLHEALRLIAPQLNAAGLDLYVERFKAAFLRMNTDPDFHEPLYDGAIDLLHGLKRDGWRLALATGQSRRGVARNLAREGWADLFLSSHCAEDGPGKPDPAMLLAAMSACDAAPETTVMIGDTAHDATMAVNAGVLPIGVSWGFHTIEEQRAAGVVHVASDFPDLEAALARFASQTLHEKTA